MHVQTHLVGPSFILDRHGPESALPQRPHPLVARVEPGCVAQVQPLHRRAQIRIRRPHHPVPVIVHQRKCMDRHPVAITQRPEQFQKMFAVTVVKKHIASLDTTVKHMVPTVFPIASQSPSHARSIS